MAEQNCAGKVSKIKNFFRKMWTYLCRILKKRNNVQEQPNDPEPETTENPWIFATRSIIEQILWQKQDVIREEKEELGGRLTRKQLYRDFKPLIIDTDTPDQVFGEDDDVDQILRLYEPTGRFCVFYRLAGDGIRSHDQNFSTGCDAGEPCKRGT